MKQLLEAESKRERQRYLMRDAYERKPQTADYGNGSYEGRGDKAGNSGFGWRGPQKAPMPEAPCQPVGAEGTTRSTTTSA